MSAIAGLVGAAKKFGSIISAVDNGVNGSGDFRSAVLQPAATIMNMMANTRKAINRESIKSAFNDPNNVPTQNIV